LPEQEKELEQRYIIVEQKRIKDAFNRFRSALVDVSHGIMSVSELETLGEKLEAETAQRENKPDGGNLKLKPPPTAKQRAITYQPGPKQVSGAIITYVLPKPLHPQPPRDFTKYPKNLQLAAKASGFKEDYAVQRSVQEALNMLVR